MTRSELDRREVRRSVVWQLGIIVEEQTGVTHRRCGGLGGAIELGTGHMAAFTACHV